MSLHQNSFSEVLAWQISADICQHILPSSVCNPHARRLRRQPERTGAGATARREQAALAQLAAWGIVPQPANDRAVSIMTVCRWKITKAFVCAVPDDTGGAGMSNDTPFDALGNECWRAAGRRSVNPVLTTGYASARRRGVIKQRSETHARVSDNPVMIGELLREFPDYTWR